MQIQIKQNEIIEALKLYLASKGLDLNGKQVEAEFSMTRKPSQVIAEVNITDVMIPGFSDAEDDMPTIPLVATTLAVVRNEPAAVVISDNPAPEEEDREEVVTQDNPETKKTTSLFGG